MFQYVIRPWVWMISASGNAGGQSVVLTVRRLALGNSVKAGSSLSHLFVYFKSPFTIFGCVEQYAPKIRLDGNHALRCQSRHMWA